MSVTTITKVGSMTIPKTSENFTEMILLCAREALKQFTLYNGSEIDLFDIYFVHLSFSYNNKANASIRILDQYFFDVFELDDSFKVSPY